MSQNIATFDIASYVGFLNAFKQTFFSIILFWACPPKNFLKGEKVTTLIAFLFKGCFDLDSIL